MIYCISSLSFNTSYRRCAPRLCTTWERWPSGPCWSQSYVQSGPWWLTFSASSRKLTTRYVIVSVLGRCVCLCGTWRLSFLMLSSDVLKHSTCWYYLFDLLPYRWIHTQVAEYALCCVQCCLGCLERCIRFINKHAYIITAIYSYPFCKSTRKAFWLLLR